jgi:hypothetical protein
VVQDLSAEFMVVLAILFHRHFLVLKVASLACLSFCCALSPFYTALHPPSLRAV